MYDHGGMNRFYRLVWSEAKQCFIPIPEVSNKRGKRKGGVFATLAAAALALLSAATGALADPGPAVTPVPMMGGIPGAASTIAADTLPTGGTVVAGQASIAQSGDTQTITQTSQNAAIDWQSFSIGSGGKVVFQQPNASAIALNRVIGGDASKIYGVLQSNGQVFLVNPNGVLFAKGAQVSTAGLMASTRDMSVADFMAGNYHLTGSGAGTVTNQGSLTAANGGYVVLTGAQVVNDGDITARGGDVRLAAGNDITIRIDNGSLAGLTIGQGAYDALVANGGVIRADGGRIYLTADALDQLSKAAVNNTGLVEAQSIASVGGDIVLGGNAATVSVTGALDASASNGKGGTITVAGNAIDLGEGASLNASGATGGGTVRVGGGWQGKDSDIVNAASVLMAPSATIDVSATQKGDGGTAVLWSQDRTGFYGTIKAAGADGAGGKVETSSHNHLDAMGAVTGGQWLLDPVNVTIASSGQSGTGYSDTYNPTADSTILASSINNSLNAGTAVTITTGSTGTSNGDITVNAAITQSTYPSTGYGSLTLKAANNIIVNNIISASANMGRLNVVMTADSDNSGVGGISFGAGGKVLTNGGNFYAGNLTNTSTAGANAKSGQAFTMAAGSQIDTTDSYLTFAGLIDIHVNGTVTLAANSLVDRPDSTGNFHYNDGTSSNDGPSLTIAAGSILTGNSVSTTPDILSRVGASLTADTGNIGSSSASLKIASYSKIGGGPISVSNSGGSSWLNLLTTQTPYDSNNARPTNTLNLSVGTQANSTQTINILGDSGGNQHVRATTDGSGIVQVATGGITNAGSSGLNIGLSGTSLHFADGAVSMSGGTFTASGTTLTGTSGGGADITGSNITLSANDVGTSVAPIELSDPSWDGTYFGGSLTVSNNGGSTYLKSVNDGFAYINFSNGVATGTHSLLFSGGDHIQYTTNGTGILTTTISGGTSDGSTFGATTGILVGGNIYRGLTLTENTGNIIFGDNSVSMPQGDFTATIPLGNTSGVIRAQNLYTAGAQAAQITAANVSLSAQNKDTPTVTDIGGNGYDIQVAGVPGYYPYGTSLSVSTQSANVRIHELTENFFQTINISLGQVNTTQNIAIDLKGADDINFSDDGSKITLDATKVALTSGNRYFTLSAGDRVIEEDGLSLAGGYNLSGYKLLLNGDIRTTGQFYDAIQGYGYGGDISLTGSRGVDIMKSIVLDSNNDRTGASGGVSVSASTDYSGTISATGTGKILTVNTSSSDDAAGSINLSSDINNRAGAYLAGLSLDAGSVAGTDDGGVALYQNNVLLDGDFHSTGKTQLGAKQAVFTLNTNASNGTTAGNISFDGDSITSYYLSDVNYATTGLVFNASATGTNGVGGNVDLNTDSTLTTHAVTVNAAGGTGGHGGDISLGGVTGATSGADAQSYTGRTITLYGDLDSNNANLTFNGAARLGNSVTVKSGDGATTFNNGISATAAGQNLTMGSNSSSGDITFSTDNSGGAYINTLTVDGGSAAVIASNVATEGSQIYTGGSMNVSGSFTTNGGDIDFSNSYSIFLQGNITLNTDKVGGSSDAGQLRLGSNNISGSGRTITIDTTADGGGANAALTLNRIGYPGNAGDISIAAGSITLNGIIYSNGNVAIEARGANADLTIASSGQIRDTASGKSIVLVAGRNFLNNRTTNGIQVGGSSHYYVYSTNPANTTEGLTGYSKHYNQNYTAGSTPTYATSGNWFFYSIAPTISVTPNGTSIGYGSADPSLALTASNYSGFIDGDTFAGLTGTQTLSLASGILSGAGYRQAGTYAYSLNGTLTDSLGYTYAPMTASLVVNKASLGVTGLTAANREYNGTTTVGLTGTPTVTGSTLSGDVVSVDVSSITGSVTDGNVGTGKMVTIGGTAGLTGADAGNYTLTPPGSLTVDITRKALTVTGSTVTGKTYDGSNAATVTAGTVTGFVGSETIGATASGSFGDANAGTGKTVTTTYSLSNGANGGLASNYSLASQNLSGDIAKKALTITGSTATGKTYDGSNSASVTAGTLSGFVGTETVTATGSGTYGDANAGTGKTVTTTYTLANGTHGGLAANYSLVGGTLSADIAKKALTISGSTVTGKTYDGSNSASITAGTLSGFIGTETVTASASGSFGDVNAGTGKSVTTTYSLSNGTNGGLASNYSLAGQSLSGDIARKALTIAGSTVTGKTYDGSNSASVAAGTLSGFVGTETVTAQASGTFGDANAGTGKSVTTTYGLSNGTNGGLASNYSLAGQSLSGDIAKKALTISGSTVAGKTYDGGVSATITAGTLSGLVGTETVTALASGSFDDKAAGTAKSVTTTYSLSNGTNGGLASNYSLSGQSLTGDIAKKTVTVTAAGQNKTYDGSTLASASLASGGIIGNDDVSFSGTAALTDKNAGTGRTVDVTGITASGNDSGNYAFVTTAQTTIDVAKKTITLAAEGNDRTYDGTLGVGVSLFSGGIVSGDDLSLNGTGSMADKNAGTGKSVSVTGITGSGADLGNYDFATTASATVDIAKKVLTTTATGQDRTYDGTTSVGVTVAAAGGLVTGDDLTFAGTGTLADKNAGDGKAVTVAFTTSGNDAGNYDVQTSGITTVDIAKKTVTTTSTGVVKTYDGATTVAVNVTGNGIVTGDDVAFTGQGTASDKNAGTGKTVSVGNIAAAGADAGNYAYATTGATTVDVAKKTITLAATGQDKTYDGSTSVGVSLASGGVVAGDTVAFSGTGTLSDKTAGTGKTVAVANIAASGADAGNYAYATTGATTVDVAKKTITVAATGQNKTYDGSTSVGVSLASGGVVAGDTVAFSGTGTLSDKTAGTGKTVAVGNIAASGADAGNYAYATTGSTTVDVAKKTITVAATGQDKTYDGSTSVGVSLASGDIVSGDTVTFSGTGTMSDKNVGTGKTVSVGSIAASGADAGNYAYATTGSTTVDVAKKTITVAATGQDKTYDGSTSVGVSLASGGIVSGDTVAFSGTGTLSDKSAGSGKTVAVGNIAASGADAGNYAYATTGATTVDVAKKTVTVDAAATGKTYDGANAVAVALASTGIVAGDSVAFTGTGTTADSNAGTAKTVTVANVSATGADAGNYAFSATTTTRVDVAAKAVTINLQGPVKKTGDGSTTVALTSGNYLVGGLVGSDAIQVTQTTGQFADTTAGTNKVVSVKLSGTDYAAVGNTVLGNYQLVPVTLSAAIGELVNPVTPAYTGALTSIPTTPAGTPTGAPSTTPQTGGSGPAVSTGGSDNSVSTQSSGLASNQSSSGGTSPGDSPDASASTRPTQESLSFRRTFSIADGGIKLPDGVSADGDQ